MPCQLLADCLTEIFEYLDDDYSTLHSCLLVNRLWCGISVRILWRNIWYLKSSVDFQHRFKVESAILSTLITCLPNESKELLYNNEIFIPTPTSKSPLFNYPAFCKVLPITVMCRTINVALDKIPISSLSLKDRNCLVMNEVIKMFMNQISSLKRLTYEYNKYYNNLHCTDFTSFSEAGDCLIDLSELRCNSNLPSEFYYQLSQKCHNLLSFTLYIKTTNFDIELKKLISLQNNLKNLRLSAYYEVDWTDIIPVLTKHFNTLTKLHINGEFEFIPLSFVASFSNLQEIRFLFIDGSEFEGFETLQYVTFPKLQILNIPCQCPEPEYMMKFLENNGKNLKDIKIWCGGGFLSERKVLKTVAKYSPKNFCELKIYNLMNSKLRPKDLESFCISWKNRKPKRSLSLIIIKNYCISLEEDEENMKVIEKYESLGIIKFNTRNHLKEKDDDFKFRGYY
ncbi:hypothetical protein C1645_823681 [Glomus cerebriforme]|uniref:F-box domain-containing protein n=1 Tax=Glomus cerebriforme TaxID=658196 RepID=A0A397T566_9GLOM|nr:hypothetical protein C1645_823681 [Glomus cerebriforme]